MTLIVLVETQVSETNDSDGEILGIINSFNKL